MQYKLRENGKLLVTAQAKIPLSLAYLQLKCNISNIMHNASNLLTINHTT